MLFKIERKHLDDYGILHSPRYLDFLGGQVSPSRFPNVELNLLRPVRPGTTLQLAHDAASGAFAFSIADEGESKGKVTADGKVHAPGAAIEATRAQINPRSESEWILYEQIEHGPHGSPESGPNFGWGDAVDVLSTARWNYCTHTLGLSAQQVIRDGFAFVASRFEVLALNPVSKTGLGPIRMSSRVDRMVRPGSHFVVQFELSADDSRGGAQGLLAQGWMSLVCVQLATGRPTSAPEHYWKYIKKV